MNPTLSHHLTGAIAAALLSSAAQAAPRHLDIAALERTTAGAQSLAPSSTAADGALIVADRSTIDVQRRREISLQARAHENTAALNVVNAAGSDVANALNISTTIGTRVLGRQMNDILQIEHSYGRVERISLAGPNLSRSYTDTRTRSWSNSEGSSQLHVLRSHSRSSVIDTWSTGVPGYNPVQNVDIDLALPTMPSVSVDPPRFDFITEVAGVKGGFAGDIGPFVFGPPELVLGELQFTGDDIVISGGHVQLPSLDLGSADLTVCVGACATVSVPLPEIDGPRIEFDESWTLEGANPFKDLRINAGHGIAIAGSGYVNVDASHVTLGAELSLDLPDPSTSFSFGLLGETIESGDFEVEIPAIGISVTLVDADIGPGFRAEFDGSLCLAIQTNDCGTLAHSETSESTLVDVRLSTASSSQSSYEENSSLGEEHITPSAILTGAEAELIAMSEGSAQIDQSSSIDLSSQAQRNLSAINAINATGAIVGNALNVSTLASGVATGVNLAQSNSFAQFKTRPRGP